MTDADPTQDEPLEADAPRRPLDHAIVENEDLPDECAIFPRDATEAELRTRWLVAGGDGFVALESMR